MHVFIERTRVVISINPKQAQDLAAILLDYERRSENPFRCEMAGTLRCLLTGIECEALDG